MDLNELFEKLNGYREENIDDMEIANMLIQHPDKRETIISAILGERLNLNSVIQKLKELIEPVYDGSAKYYNNEIRNVIKILEERNKIYDINDDSLVENEEFEFLSPYIDERIEQVQKKLTEIRSRIQRMQTEKSLIQAKLNELEKEMYDTGSSIYDEEYDDILTLSDKVWELDEKIEKSEKEIPSLEDMLELDLFEKDLEIMQPEGVISLHEEMLEQMDNVKENDNSRKADILSRKLNCIQRFILSSQELTRLLPSKEGIDSDLLEIYGIKNSRLEQREAELSSLEAEEKTISETEALIDKQNQEQGKQK